MVGVSAGPVFFVAETLALDRVRGRLTVGFLPVERGDTLAMLTADLRGA
jgi:hypothetical protein